MTAYLNYQFDDNEAFINTFDELPLWSAYFGILLLKHLNIKPNLTVIDIGSGAGFPIMELAGRLGSSCKLYGIDPWVNATNRAKQKIINYGLTNVEIIESSAVAIPFPNQTIDLIVSNLGINNFDNPNEVFKECSRVLKLNGQLVLTSNLNGHWNKFYEIFYLTLKQIGKESYIVNLKKEEEHRGSIESISTLFTTNGFKVSRIFEDSFEMKFVDGTAFLNHYFIKLGWLSSWLKLFTKEDLEEIFSALEQNLNDHSKENNGLTLTVPMVFMEGEKL
ncbi:MAG: methyltransferase domain-containing protein [Bacteroidia bacterium]|nr:methyltransferase domain-containing protein [Bacteroidia bacterium]MCF8426642.1 methyltransferase domain-containing protein [Bacteroidia bacterium]MCF8446970.1 methyltransferase domain-containing protein [Bacteroidia bacterium]